MSLTVSTAAGEIAAVLEPLIATDPVRHTIFSTITGILATERGDGWCAWDGAANIAARSQPTTPLTLAGGWPQVGPLADAVMSLETLAAVGGPIAPVEALVGKLARLGHVERARVSERLFRLDALVGPLGVAGSARLAGPDDAQLLAEWFTAFMREAWPSLPAGFDAAEQVARALERGRPWLWLNPSGTPVAMAASRNPSCGVARIGPVYTPPDLRGRGYGSAVTAAASADIQALNAVPVLYTDLANPTSNKIYQRLGYRPVEDRLHVDFE